MTDKHSDPPSDQQQIDRSHLRKQFLVFILYQKWKKKREKKNQFTGGLFRIYGIFFPVIFVLPSSISHQLIFMCVCVCVRCVNIVNDKQLTTFSRHLFHSSCIITLHIVIVFIQIICLLCRRAVTQHVICKKKTNTFATRIYVYIITCTTFLNEQPPSFIERIYGINLSSFVLFAKQQRMRQPLFIVHTSSSSSPFSAMFKQKNNKITLFGCKTLSHFHCEYTETEYV